MDCTNKRIAFTGVSVNYDRSAIYSAIKARGGIVVNAVNRNTDLLILGENPGNGTGKRDAAEKHGTPTLMANQFMNATGPWPFSDRPSAAAERQKRAAAKKAQSQARKRVASAVNQLDKAQAASPYVGF